jgi:hypothetical protein
MSRYFVRVSKTKVVDVDSLLAAGRAVRDEIEGPLGWVGSTRWYRTIAGHSRGVTVYNEQQRPVATVSYNGRLWALDGSEIVAS